MDILAKGHYYRYKYPIFIVFFNLNHMDGNVLGSTTAAIIFGVAINFFYNILNYLIARSVGDELQFSLQSGNSNFIIVITPP